MIAHARNFPTPAELAERRAKNVFTGRIGAAIRTARVCHGLTQTRLAEESGLGLATIARAEAGEVEVRATTILRVERALGLSPGLIFRLAA